MASWAPRWARSRATSLPRPLVAPVMTAIGRVSMVVLRPRLLLRYLSTLSLMRYITDRVVSECSKRAARFGRQASARSDSTAGLGPDQLDYWDHAVDPRWYRPTGVPEQGQLVRVHDRDRRHRDQPRSREDNDHSEQVQGPQGARYAGCHCPRIDAGQAPRMMRVGVG